MFVEIKFNGKENILNTLRKHKVVKITNHAIRSADDLIAFAKTFGELYKWPFGYVNELKVDKNSKNYLYSEEPVPFHWDGAFATSPYLLVFHCIKAPTDKNSGNTLFTDTQKIFNSLSNSEQELLRDTEVSYKTEKLVHYGGECRQKILDFHPETHEPILRIAEEVFSSKNPVQRTILGDNVTAKNELIKKIEHKLYSDEFCYQHIWQDNELLIADNHSLVHGRTKLTPNCWRHLRRVQIL